MKNKFFEIFVLILLTLGLATIGILYIREKSRTRTISPVNPQDERLNRHRSSDRIDILSRLRDTYLQNRRNRRSETSNRENTRQSNQRTDQTRISIPEGRKGDEYLFKKAVLEYRHLRYDDAIKTVDKLLLNYPNSNLNLRARCYQGMAFVKKGRQNWNREQLNVAKNILIEALNNYINNPDFKPEEITEFIIAIGEANRSIGGNNSDIEFLLKKASVTAPQIHRNEINVQLGYIALFREQTGEAMTYFMKSNSELSRIGIARTYIKMGKHHDAFRIYNEFVKYNKESEYYEDVKKAYITQAFYWGKRAFSEGKYERAYLFLMPVINNFPTMPEYEEGVLLVAESLYQKGDKDKALIYFKRISSEMGTRFGDMALFRIGQIYYSNNAKNEALNTFERLITYHADSRLKREALRYKKIILEEMANIQGRGRLFDDFINEDESRPNNPSVPPANISPQSQPNSVPSNSNSENIIERERDMLRSIN